MEFLSHAHPERPHYIDRSNWLRAAVLGANDGIVSISALVVGVAAAEPSPAAVFLAGFAGLSAGAMSMAACENGGAKLDHGSAVVLAVRAA